MSRLALLFCLLLGYAAALYADEFAELRAQAQQGLAPDFTLQDLAGESHQLSQWRGKLVLINFWATWCAPCRAEMPGLRKLWLQYRDQGFEVVVISVDEGMKPRVARFVEMFELDFPVLLDPDSTVSDRYQVGGLPHSVFIAPDGTLIAKVIGEREWDSEPVKQWIEALLSKPAVD